MSSSRSFGHSRFSIHPNGTLPTPHLYFDHASARKPFTIVQSFVQFIRYSGILSFYTETCVVIVYSAYATGYMIAHACTQFSLC